MLPLGGHPVGEGNWFCFFVLDQQVTFTGFFFLLLLFIMLFHISFLLMHELQNPILECLTLHFSKTFIHVHFIVYLQVTS